MNRNIKKGEVIFREGSFSDSAFIIEKGRFEVSKKVNDKKVVIGILKKNEIFGELGLIDGLPRSATVTALEDSRISILSKDNFESLAHLNPHALVPLLKILSQRMRQALALAGFSGSSPSKSQPQPFNSGGFPTQSFAG